MIERVYSTTADTRICFAFALLVISATVCISLRVFEFYLLSIFPIFALCLFPELIATIALSPLVGGRPQLGRNLCNWGLTAIPCSVALHSARGLIEFRAKNYEEAELHISSALNGNPHSSVNLTNRAAVRCCLGRFDQAEIDAHQAIKYAPYEFLAYHNRAVARFGCQNFKGCLEDCRYLQKKGYDNESVRLLIAESYLLMGMIAEVDALAATAIGTPRPGSGDALIVAFLRYFRNHFVEVLADCAEVDERHPLAFYFVNLQGFAYFNLSEGELTMQCANRAIALNHRAENAYLLKAYLLAEIGEVDKALTICALPQVAGAITSYARNGEAYVQCRAGNFEKALELNTKAWEKCPDTIDTMQIRSCALAGLGRSEEALAVANRAVQTHRLAAGGWAAKANAEILLNDYPAALISLNTGLAANPHSRECYQLRAKVNEYLGNSLEAERDQNKYDELRARLAANLSLYLEPECAV